VILLYGPASDEPLAEVRAELFRCGAPVFFVDQQEVLQTSIQLSVGSRVTGTVRVGRKKVDLESVESAYLRMCDPRELPDIAAAGKNSAVWNHALRLHEALECWAEVTSARVVNRPSAAWGNSKPCQSHMIRSVGFDYPETLVTTDPGAALRFWKAHKKVIYKSVSGIRSVVARLTPAHRKRLTDLRWCPTQFQRFVPGTEFRVHVIGEKVFASEIVSEAVDYRYAEKEGMSAGSRFARLPSEIAKRCRLLTAGMNLFAAGIDLRRTPQGRWYCLEINRSPGFTYFEDVGKHPIGGAIARLLLSEAPIRARFAPAKKSANPVRKHNTVKSLKNTSRRSGLFT
jgi:glutathione synthase/RimK-type ligase-like ATP-grasp enzyme